MNKDITLVGGVEALAQYAQEGIPLIPIKDGKYLVADGRYRETAIKTREEIEERLEAGLTAFRLIPKEIVLKHGKRLIVIDIDRHDPEKDGLAQWEKLISKIKYCPERLNIAKHPCVVKTPRGGYHLYFKITDTGFRFNSNLDSAVEVRFSSPLPITAGGSVSEKGQHLLKGSLSDVPPLPVDLLPFLCQKKGIKPLIFPAVNKDNYKDRLIDYWQQKGKTIHGKYSVNCPCPDHKNGDSNPSGLISNTVITCTVAGKSYDIFEVAGFLSGSTKFTEKLAEVKRTIGD